MWKSGDVVTLRGIYNRRAWYVQSAVVVQDRPEEVALAILPGAECFAPEGYINGKHGAKRGWDRWDDYVNDNWKMQRYNWHTNRLLILLEPEKYYASIYFWQDDVNEFLCYYINFQLPFRRSAIGFDTLDLELDIIVEPSHEWRWKDLDDYQRGIDRGIILKEWTNEIDCAKQEIFEKLAKRQYPLDGKWLNWKPDPSWPTPKLPESWNEV
ncbi:MAG: DUF402 domain-containing protein [Chloroflexi bacterium]|nr:DUF402 domain-containing protein [Chloroflexota bacterium]